KEGTGTEVTEGTGTEVTEGTDNATTEKRRNGDQSVTDKILRCSVPLWLHSSVLSVTSVSVPSVTSVAVPSLPSVSVLSVGPVSVLSVVDAQGSSSRTYSRTTVSRPTNTARETIAGPIDTSSRCGSSRNSTRLSRSRSWPALTPSPSAWAA